MPYTRPTRVRAPASQMIPRAVPGVHSCVQSQVWPRRESKKKFSGEGVMMRGPPSSGHCREELVQGGPRKGERESGVSGATRRKAERGEGGPELRSGQVTRRKPSARLVSSGARPRTRPSPAPHAPGRRSPHAAEAPGLPPLTLRRRARLSEASAVAGTDSQSEAASRARPVPGSQYEAVSRGPPRRRQPIKRLIPRPPRRLRQYPIGSRISRPAPGAGSQ